MYPGGIVAMTPERRVLVTRLVMVRGRGNARQRQRGEAM